MLWGFFGKGHGGLFTFYCGAMKCVLYSRKTGTFLPKSGGREWGELSASFRPLIGIVADCLGIRPHCGW